MNKIDIDNQLTYEDVKKTTRMKKAIINAIFLIALVVCIGVVFH